MGEVKVDRGYRFSARLNMHLSVLRSHRILVYGDIYNDMTVETGMVTSITFSPSQNLEGGSR